MTKQEPVSSQPSSDAVARVVPGARLTFVELYRATFADMVRLAYLLTGSEETAQDLVQESFAKLHPAYGRVREPRAYLRRSVVNGCTSHHRRGFRQRRATAATRPVSTELDADELFDVLDALPARQRAAIVLRYWHDLSENEIAAVLGCRRGTVASLLHRGIAALREVIEP